MQTDIKDYKKRENKTEDKVVDESCSERSKKDGRKSKSL